MNPTASRLQVSWLDGGLLAVAGEIDAETSGEFESSLAGDADGPVRRVDLSGVTFMDSSGLRVLLAHHKRLGAGDESFEIVAPSRVVERLFEITGLTEELNLQP